MSKESDKEPNFGSYAKIGLHRTVCVRGSIYEQFPNTGWPPELARDYAAYIVQLADEAEMNDPEVVQLTVDLEEIDMSGEDDTWSDLALALKRKGYHR